MSWEVIGNNVKFGKNVKLGPWVTICDDAVIGDNVTFGNWSIVLFGETVPDGYVLGDYEVYPRPYKEYDRQTMEFHRNASWILRKDHRDLYRRDRD